MVVMEQLSAENAGGRTALWMAENGIVRKGEDAKDDVVEYLESKIESDKCEKAEGADSGEIELEIEESSRA